MEVVSSGSQLPAYISEFPLQRSGSECRCYRQLTATHCERHKKQINSLYGQNEKLLSSNYVVRTVTALT